MQIKLFTIPILDGGSFEAEMNVFLRSKKILQVDQHLVAHTNSAFWCFCIRYTEDVHLVEKERVKTDYRQVLSKEVFERFSALRVIRKRVAEAEGVPAYIVFTDEELAAMAKLEVITASSLKTIKGVADKKIEKYGRFFIHEEQEGTD